MSAINVTKRNATKEPVNYDKIHKVVDWAGEGLNTSTSQVVMAAKLEFIDGIMTEDIHDILIKTAADLTSEENPDYAILAGRLLTFDLRKRAFGEFTPPTLHDQITHLVRLGKYDKQLLTDYTIAELEELNGALDHSRDLEFEYAAMKQFKGKYLVQDRVSGAIYESPQFIYMLVGACLFSAYDKDIRLGMIKDFYEAASLHKISLPTPIMSGVRTPTRQFSSCVLIESGDSLDSIDATAGSIVRYVSQRAGIGVNFGRIRALGSKIRNGEAFHTGKHYAPSMG